MTPTQNGTKTEAICLSALIKDGWNVSIPFGPCEYDLVAEKDGLFVRIQCKTGWEYKACIRFKASSKTRSGKLVGYAEKADVFMVYCNDNLYWVPVDQAPITGGNLRIEEAKGKQKSNPNIKWASDYQMGL